MALTPHTVFRAGAAIATLVIGSVLGAIVFFLDWYKDEAWLKQIIEWKVSFMMAAFYLFVVCSGILVTISLFSPAPASAEVDKLVWKSPLHALRGTAWRGIGNYKLLAGVLFAIMVCLYVVFR